MNIQKNINLKPYNTFGINVTCDFFVEILNLDDLKEALDFAKKNQLKILILNGGSNILFTQDFNGLVLKIALKGKVVDNLTNEYALVTAQAGENWHEFVQWTLENDFGGLENLSLIPGNVGTAPMQNIGAYGVEVKNTMQELLAIDIKTYELKKFNNTACNFGYRESIFKNELKNKYIILSVQFQLTRIKHTIQTHYGAIASELKNLGIEKATIQDVSRAVINIRQSKLPNPKEIGNAGSFFKNPVVTKQQYKELQKKYTDLVGYVVDENYVKLAAGWLIEKAGWKGKKNNNAGVHTKQALVLVNYGNATGQEIYNLSEQIKTDVFKKFEVALEREVNIV